MVVQNLVVVVAEEVNVCLVVAVVAEEVVRLGVVEDAEEVVVLAMRLQPIHLVPMAMSEEEQVGVDLGNFATRRPDSFALEEPHNYFSYLRDEFLNLPSLS